MISRIEAYKYRCFNTLDLALDQQHVFAGSNGSGKTTLLRIMLGKETPDAGNIQLDKSTTIGYLAQDIIVGNDQSILEEVLNAFPELKEIESKMHELTNAIAIDENNNHLVNELGEVQNHFEALGGWTMTQTFSLSTTQAVIDDKVSKLEREVDKLREQVTEMLNVDEDIMEQHDRFIRLLQDNNNNSNSNSSYNY